MNPNTRIRTAALGVVLSATTLLAPLTASADPGISATVDGSSAINGGQIAVDQTVSITGSGCSNGSNDAYMGEFVSTADPLTDAEAFKAYEVATVAGAFNWTFVMAPGDGTGTFGSRWYCSNGEASSLQDLSQMQWVGPMITMTIDAPESAPSAMAASKTTASAKTVSKAKASAKRSKVGASASASSTTGTTMTVDPNALPAIDKVGIVGAKAAKLKAKVDAQYAKDVRGIQVLAKLFASNKTISAALDHAAQDQYVETSFDVLTTKNPSAKVVKAYTDRLEAGDIRVSVVEDVALTAHNAAWWNAQK